MNRTILCLVVPAVVVLSLLIPCEARAEDNLWYRGLFDGEVEISDEGIGLYKYSPARLSIYPLHQQRYSLTSYFQWRRPQRTVTCRPKPKEEAGDKTNARDKDKTVYTLYPLPGQYWYKRQPHFNFRTPITVGWPYVKYDQRY